jgi:hypothetical protein
MAQKRRRLPQRLTPEIGDKIIALVRRGAHRETACASAGISKRTLEMWLERAKGGPHSTRYKRFAEALAKVEADTESVAVSAIIFAGKQDWRALAWVLERRGAQRWNSKRAAEKKDESRKGTLSDLIALRLENSDEAAGEGAGEPKAVREPEGGDPAENVPGSEDPPR